MALQAKDIGSFFDEVSDELPAMDDELGDDLEMPFDVVAGKAIHCGLAGESNAGQITSQDVSESITQQGLDATQRHLNDVGKVICTVNNNGEIQPVIDAQNKVVCVNNTQQNLVNYVLDIRHAKLYIQILKLQDEILQINPSLTVLIKSMFKIDFKMGEVQLRNILSLLKELSDAALVDKTAVHFVEFLIIIVGLSIGVPDQYLSLERLSMTPMLQIVINRLITDFIPMDSRAIRLVTLMGSIYDSVGGITMIKYVKSISTGMLK